MTSAREGTSEYYRRLRSSINKVHNNLIRDNITNLKDEGWTFGIESVKRGEKNYHYFYRQRRIKASKNKHERVRLDAKDEDDYRNRVLRNQANQQVFNNLAHGWAAEGLTPSEDKTLEIIQMEAYKRKRDRNPIIQEYIKQLGVQVHSWKYSISGVSWKIKSQQKKNILKAAAKCFKRQLFVKTTKIEVSPET
jgi:hypothetical protein